MFIACMLYYCLGWLIETGAGSTARPWTHPCKIVLQEQRCHPEYVAQEMQCSTHQQAIQPGIQNVRWLTNCSFGPVGALNERTRVGNDPDNPGVKSCLTLILETPDWRELNLKSGGTSPGYFRRRRDSHSGDEPWDEDTYIPNYPLL